MGTETGRRKLILMPRLLDHRDQAPFDVGADKLRALPHLRHTYRHLLPRPRAGTSSQLLICLIPALRSQSLHVPTTTTLPMPRG